MVQSRYASAADHFALPGCSRVRHGNGRGILYVTNCKRVRISNVKTVGHYVDNDGIPIGGASDALVEDCFTHNPDDNLEVKVWIPQRNK